MLPTTQRHRTVLPRLRSSNNGDGGAPPQSIDDDSESGLGKLRFNKRVSCLLVCLRMLTLCQPRNSELQRICV